MGDDNVQDCNKCTTVVGDADSGRGCACVEQGVNKNSVFFFYKFIYLFTYLFLAVLGLRCCARVFSSCSERGLLFIAVRGLLTAVASLVAEHGL